MIYQGSIVVFDAAYAPFIRNPDMPKSIFEIEGARSCCIEVTLHVLHSHVPVPFDLCKLMHAANLSAK